MVLHVLGKRENFNQRSDFLQYPLPLCQYYARNAGEETVLESLDLSRYHIYVLKIYKLARKLKIIGVSLVCLFLFTDGIVGSKVESTG